MPHPMTRPLMKFAGRLRFPQLFVITAIAFIADLIIPDVIPFIDEILLGLLTLLFASLRQRQDRDPGAK